jgi:hypothetical protein
LQGEAGRVKAERHLAEAQRIAERGPMPLYLADVHLHRARLVAGASSPPAAARSPGPQQQAKARTLIDRHQYNRRREELEDAESAAANWSELDYDRS